MGKGGRYRYFFSLLSLYLASLQLEALMHGHPSPAMGERQQDGGQSHCLLHALLLTQVNSAHSKRPRYARQVERASPGRLHRLPYTACSDDVRMSQAQGEHVRTKSCQGPRIHTQNEYLFDGTGHFVFKAARKTSLFVFIAARKTSLFVFMAVRKTGLFVFITARKTSLVVFIAARKTVSLSS